MAAPRTKTLASIALVSTGLLLFGAPSAAFAHTDSLYTWAYDQDAGDDGKFVTVSKTDAQLQAVSSTGELVNVVGMEICDEVGYAVGNFEDGIIVFEWNHSTGYPVGGPVELVADVTAWDGADSVEIENLVDLDTTADCTLLSIVGFSVQNDQETMSFVAVSSIDPETGLVTPLVEIPVDDPEDMSLATDPLTATTYLFLEFDGSPAFTPLDLDAGTYGEPETLGGVIDFFDSGGFPQGADFDATGTLWIIVGVNALESYRLVSLAAPSANLGTTSPDDIGSLPYSGEPRLLVDPFIPLTVDPAGVVPDPDPDPEPVLPATGPTDTGIVYLGAALLLAGALVALSRRRTV